MSAFESNKHALHDEPRTWGAAEVDALAILAVLVVRTEDVARAAMRRMDLRVHTDALAQSLVVRARADALLTLGAVRTPVVACAAVQRVGLGVHAVRPAQRVVGGAGGLAADAMAQHMQVWISVLGVGVRDEDDHHEHQGCSEDLLHLA